MNAVDKYNQRAADIHSLVCVGLDSDINRLPLRFGRQAWPQFAFNRHIMEQTAPFAAAFKFNMAYYEANGAEGWRQLALSLAHSQKHHPDILTICDAKRSDIGSTSAAYAQAIFDQLGFDAVTLNPYLGRDALQPFLDYSDKAAIILCRTSNAGSGELQNLRVGEEPLWQIVAERVASEWNSNRNCMLVAAATYPDEMARIRALVGDMTLLAPGIGAQGGDVEAVVTAGLNRHGRGLIINSSRGIIFDDHPAQAAEALRNRINRYRR